MNRKEVEMHASADVEFLCPKEEDHRSVQYVHVVPAFNDAN